MFKGLIINILFKLLKIESKTTNLMLFEDMSKFSGHEPEVIARVQETIREKYNIAKADAYNNEMFVQFLYLTLVEKQREHVKTFDKDKKAVQLATILFILWLVEEMKKADDWLKRTRKSSVRIRKEKINLETAQQKAVKEAYKKFEKTEAENIEE